MGDTHRVRGGDKLSAVPEAQSRRDGARVGNEADHQQDKRDDLIDSIESEKLFNINGSTPLLSECRHFPRCKATEKDKIKYHNF